ncbi:MAG: hypothetical protein NC124_17010 [Clostridium sp.]|nr:hypothetical protein [Clostridium sp.]
MDFLGLSDAFLKDSERYCTYDENIPFQYRVIAKLLSEDNYEQAKKLMEANSTEFKNDYNYLLLEFAVENCLGIVIDENGTRCQALSQLKKGHRYTPAPEAIAFIEYLLKNGANPHLPENFNQMEHICDIEEDCSCQQGVRFDCSEIKLLLTKYM